MSSPPKANRTSAVTTAVATIRRPTARCVSASKFLVFSRNGTSAILGPIPISKSSRSFATSSKSITEKSIKGPRCLACLASDGAIRPLTTTSTEAMVGTIYMSRHDGQARGAWASLDEPALQWPAF